LNKPDYDEGLRVTGNDTNIPAEELTMKERMDYFKATDDNQNLVSAALDTLDHKGEKLNEKSSGQEL
jgi:hypothetical protein